MAAGAVAVSPPVAGEMVSGTSRWCMSLACVVAPGAISTALAMSVSRVPIAKGAP